MSLNTPIEGVWLSMNKEIEVRLTASGHYRVIVSIAGVSNEHPLMTRNEVVDMMLESWMKKH